MWNSFVMAVIIVVGKLIVSVRCAAMAIVYYRVPYKNLGDSLFILFTLMLPVPVRFIPLFQLINDLGWGPSDTLPRLQCRISQVRRVCSSFDSTPFRS